MMDLSWLILIGMWSYILWDASNCIRIGCRKRRAVRRQIELCRKIKGNITGHLNR